MTATSGRLFDYGLRAVFLAVFAGYLWVAQYAPHRHQPFGGCMSLLMVLLYCLVAGAMLQFQSWLIRKREALRW